VSRVQLRARAAWLGPGRLVHDAQVVCEDGSITYAGPTTPIGAADEELDVDGFLMPAVADRHVHIGLSDPAAVLRRGVTAVRDLAWPADPIFELADASELPAFDGPLVRAVGPMLTGHGGYPTRAGWGPEGTGRELNGPDDAVTVVAGLAARGATAIKVSLNAEAGPTPTDAELAAICDEAHRLELPVTAHAQGKGQVERALGAGVDELAHAPWTERLSEGALEAAAARMRIVSTLHIHGSGSSLEIALDNVRRFRAAGGEVSYGTDLGNGGIPPGIDAREARLLAEAGLTNEDVLAAMIRAPLDEDAPADLIALGADPLRDLGAFDDLILVARGGSVVVAR
jgi:imidazolonepropionase-like amidohydrolase